MAKVLSTLFISADGVAEIDPDWHFPYFDENMGRAVGEDYDTADVLLIGRETYDSFAGAWPGREAAGGDDAPFARQLGDVRKVLVSRQQLEFSWRNSELINGDLLDAVTSLKADAGIRGILIPGSISVVQQLLAARVSKGAGAATPPTLTDSALISASPCLHRSGQDRAGRSPAGMRTRYASSCYEPVPA